MSHRLIVATRKGLLILKVDGDCPCEIESVHFVGDPVTMALHDPATGHLYAAVGHGHFGVKLHRSADGGGNWTEIASPAYPERPADREPDKCPMRGIEIPWRTEMAWSLEAGPDPDNPTGRTLWCGTIPGGLFRSDDLGDSWSLVESLWHHPDRTRWFGGGYDYAGIHSICIDPRDPRRLTLGVSCGGIWRSDDAGQSWRCDGKGMNAAYLPPDQAEDPVQQDPHRLVQCPAQPDHLWVQHHCGIFRSTDAGDTWRTIKTAEPSTFGFAVAVHPTDPDTAWFVPAHSDQLRVPVDGRIVVTRTRDGGKTFDTLSRGLPERNAYHLIYRHALDVDAAGRQLAFGSTTGSLWTSPDAGDTWHRLSADLPPIHAVRFIGSQA